MVKYIYETVLRRFTMEEKTVKIQGKTINYGNLSDEQLIKLYENMKKREAMLYDKIMSYDEKYHFLSEIDSND